MVFICDNTGGFEILINVPQFIGAPHYHSVYVNELLL